MSLSAAFYIIPAGRESIVQAGQNEGSVISVSGESVSDGRTLTGGRYMFTIALKRSVGNNSLTTSSSGYLQVIAGRKIYKGQLVRINRKYVLSDRNHVVYAAENSLEVSGWRKGAWGEILKIRAEILEFLLLRISRLNNGPEILFTALFTGIREDPRGPLFTALRMAGASHVLALSGMHLGIISMGVLLILSLFLGKRTTFFLTLMLVVLYLVLVDAGPSLYRAALFFTITGVIRLTGRSVDLFRVLVLCFLAQALLDPQSAGTLSFQLSYLALGGILFAGGSLGELLSRVLPGSAAGVIGASAAAQIFTAPLIIKTFGVVYSGGLVSSLVLIPLVTIFIWVGIVSLFIPFGYIFRFFNLFLSVIYELISESAGFFSHFPSLGFKESMLIFSAAAVLLVFREAYNTARAGQIFNH